MEIRRKELQRKIGNATVFGFVIGCAYAGIVGYVYGEQEGRKKAYKDAQLSELYATVRNLAWEAESRKMKEAAEYGSTS